MNLRTRPARVVAAVGAVVAVGTASGLALAAGTASADEPGRCTSNVNVRKEADATSRIVALCPNGKAVTLGAEQDGFVRLAEFDGWASKQFVKADESSSSSSSDSSDNADAGADTQADDHGSSSDHHGSGDHHDDAPSTHTATPGVGGLLG